MSIQNPLKKYAKFASIGVAAIGVAHVVSGSVDLMVIPHSHPVDSAKFLMYQFASPSLRFGSPLFNPISTVVLGMEILGTAMIGKKIFNTLKESLPKLGKNKAQNQRVYAKADNRQEPQIPASSSPDAFINASSPNPRIEGTSGTPVEPNPPTPILPTPSVNTVLDNISMIRKQREEQKVSNPNLKI